MIFRKAIQLCILGQNILESDDTISIFLDAGIYGCFDVATINRGEPLLYGSPFLICVIYEISKVVNRENVSVKSLALDS